MRLTQAGGHQAGEAARNACGVQLHSPTRLSAAVDGTATVGGGHSCGVLHRSWGAHVRGSDGGPLAVAAAAAEAAAGENICPNLFST